MRILVGSGFEAYEALVCPSGGPFDKVYAGAVIYENHYIDVARRSCPRCKRVFSLRIYQSPHFFSAGFSTP